jgi:hypothetical protein
MASAYPRRFIATSYKEGWPTTTSSQNIAHTLNQNPQNTNFSEEPNPSEFEAQQSVESFIKAAK